ncbi:hypothetical protein FAZ78_17670 [Cereibacter changlensis]|uniref:Tyr recombinase domain-containing protein n=1 Tax=Cereibacter changlensis TaxID=402884 RepID=A0A4U0YWS1_9RHOB|nr:tyrosine-type recombinase/integrase [Cereibacter changlensis]TKA95289.1 hypothetical protein FAZ78_17670 [Cereibacter changlensis]
MVIPVGQPLRDALEAAKAMRKAPAICTNSRGRPWTRDGFKTSFGKAQDAAGIKGVTFHDLRGTAVTRLALAGCSVPEIATITGHSLKDAETILSRHYFSRDRQLGESSHLEAGKARNVNGRCKRTCKRVRCRIADQRLTL